jgi:Domain of unknown function (DUF397)
MSTVEASRLTWRKSSRSNHDGADCVEVAVTVESVAVRDSKNRPGGMLAVPVPSWQRFLSAL